MPTAKSILPPALEKGDTIGIMAPSSRIDRAGLAQDVAALTARGFKVFVHPQTRLKDNQSAGTAQDKVKALHDLFRNPDIKAIIGARGGNRSGYMLEELDYTLIRRHPKILMGFSDSTALLNAIHVKTGLVIFHGPLLPTIGRGIIPQKQIDQSFALLAGKATPTPLHGGKVINKGRATGALVGGNLSALCSLMGTPFQPRFKGKILFIEDAGDQMSRYDRMLLQLRNAGAFRQAAGLIFGKFHESKDDGVVKFGFKLEDIIRGLTADIDAPVVMNAPFGHREDLYTLPIGMNAVLSGTTLKLDGPAVRV